MGTRIVEGCWDCDCGRKEISWRDRTCPGCGATRGVGTKYYIPKGQRKYLSEEEAKTACKNPDWQCSFCEALNSDEVDSCSWCGASKGDSEANYFQMRAKQEEKERERKEQEDRRLVGAYSSNVTDTRKLGFLIGAVSLLVFILIVAITIGLKPKTRDIDILETKWVYTQDIQELKEVYESDWSLPDEGRLVDTKSEIHHYNKVLDHYETKTRQVEHQVIVGYTTVTNTVDLGNGLFSETTSQEPVYGTEYTTEAYEEPVYRDEPVYKTKYYYNIDKWVVTDSIVTEGTDKNPVYGQITETETKRCGSQNEEYYIRAIVKHKDKSEEELLQCNQGIWAQLDAGDSLTVKIQGDSITEIVR